eukprot:3738136-Rhodomonas_salina.2
MSGCRFRIDYPYCQCHCTRGYPGYPCTPGYPGARNSYGKCYRYRGTRVGIPSRVPGYCYSARGLARNEVN